MSEQWYYQSCGHKIGPFSGKDFRKLAAAGVLTPRTLVWKEGLDGWIPASRLKLVFAESQETGPAHVGVHSDGTSAPTSIVQSSIEPAQKPSSDSSKSRASTPRSQFVGTDVQDGQSGSVLRFALTGTAALIVVGLGLFISSVGGSNESLPWGSSTSYARRELFDAFTGACTLGFGPILLWTLFRRRQRVATVLKVNILFIVGAIIFASVASSKIQDAAVRDARQRSEEEARRIIAAGPPKSDQDKLREERKRSYFRKPFEIDFYEQCLPARDVPYSSSNWEVNYSADRAREEEGKKRQKVYRALIERANSEAWLAHEAWCDLDDDRSRKHQQRANDYKLAADIFCQTGKFPPGFDADLATK